MLLDGTGGLPREQADVIIVNTCAFIRPAEEEAVEALLDLADLKQSGRRL